MITSAPELSIIIALFNSRASIEASLRSALDQECDVELIVVDDCSSDGSPEVVKRLASSHTKGDRIRLFRQEVNKGAAAARNRGVAEARGRFVSFLDSDDEYLPGFAGELLRTAERTGSQMVVGNVVHVRPDGHETERRPAVTGTFSGRRAAELALLDRITPFTCDKVIDRSLFDGVEFPEGLVNEDFLTNPVLASRAGRVTVHDVAVYRYLVSAASVTWTATTRIKQLDDSIAYLRDSLSRASGVDDGRLDGAIEAADALLTLLTGQRLLLQEPANPAVNEYRQRLLRLGPRPMMRLGPVRAAALAVFISSPRIYRRLYRRRVEKLYGDIS